MKSPPASSTRSARGEKKLKAESRNPSGWIDGANIRGRKYAVEKPSNKLLTLAELDSGTWVGEGKRIRGKKLLLTTAPPA